jgi:ammonia channel protein AmtB
VFLTGVGSAPNADYAGTIPQQTFMVYQMMFAIITPGLGFAGVMSCFSSKRPVYPVIH